MKRRLRSMGVIAIAALAILGLGAILWLGRASLPPSVSIALLSYTNRVGPYALLAITNCSKSAITLDSTYLVKYSLTQNSAPHPLASIDANKFRVTRLLPNEGFVQDVFVFPANQGGWQFECYAAYSSVWLEIKRSAESRLGKLFGRVKLPLTSKALHRFDTEWLVCPP